MSWLRRWQCNEQGWPVCSRQRLRRRSPTPSWRSSPGRFRKHRSWNECWRLFLLKPDIIEAHFQIIASVVRLSMFSWYKRTGKWCFFPTWKAATWHRPRTCTGCRRSRTKRPTWPRARGGGRTSSRDTTSCTWQRCRPSSVQHPGNYLYRSKQLICKAQILLIQAAVGHQSL